LKRVYPVAVVKAMAKKKPAKPGRKAATFDYVKIEQFAGLGLDRAEIGKALGYGKTTFFKHKRVDPKIEEAILDGRAKFKINLSNILYQQAKNGNVSAAIWLDKTRCGMRETIEDNNKQPLPLVSFRDEP